MTENQLKNSLPTRLSPAELLQKGKADDDRAPLIIVTHAAPEKSLRKALESFDADMCTVESVIRVEA